MGGYAVHIAFTDGHARGIFPWTTGNDLPPGPLPRRSTT
jgi:prepilin-type processing-associated H-X9-DG protein